MPSYISRLSPAKCLPLKKRKSSRKAFTSSTKTSAEARNLHWEADEAIHERREYFYTCEDLESIFPKTKTTEDSPILVKFEETGLANGSHKLKASKTTGKSNPRCLPYNEPAKDNVFEFETDIFSGKCLLRFKNCPRECQRYFKGRKRKQQWVFQGTFKQEIVVGDVMSGYELNAPVQNLPGKFIVKPVLSFIRKLAPTMKENLFADKPYVYNPLLQTIQTLDVSLPDQEPDMTNISLLENNCLLFLNPIEETDLSKKKIKKGKSAKERKKYFASQSHGQKYKFMPGYVYTFEFYEDKVDMGKFRLTLPLIGVDIKKHLGFEPLPIMAKVVKKDSELDNKYLFRFDVFHKKQLEQRKKAGIEFSEEEDNKVALA